MDTIISDRYAGENQIEMRPDQGLEARRYRGHYLGSLLLVIFLNELHKSLQVQKR